MNKKLVYLVTVMLIVLLFGFDFLFPSLESKTPPVPQTLIITPTPFVFLPSETSIQSIPNPTLFEKNQESFQRIAQQEEKTYQKWQTVASLKTVLPYTGSVFSLSYDYTSGSFILTLRQNNAGEGTKEFNAFLQKNGIPDKSWLEIEKLVTQYTQTTPAP